MNSKQQQLHTSAFPRHIRPSSETNNQ